MAPGFQRDCIQAIGDVHRVGAAQGAGRELVDVVPPVVSETIKPGRGIATEARTQCSITWSAIASDRHERRRVGKPGSAEIPREEQTRLVHAMLDTQYRALLDEPVPMLGNISPRTAARSARGRRNLAAWLKHVRTARATHPTQTIRW